MGRVYAGILGSLALLVAVVRGIAHGGEARPTLLTAWVVLMVFAAIGYVVGRIAQWTVDESVRARIMAEMAATQDRLPPAETN